MSKDTRKYIVYKTTNLVNGKIYIGVHATETPYEFDGYLGSGVGIQRAIRKHDKIHFKRETLFVFDSHEDAYAQESKLVTLDFVKRLDTYNMTTGGCGVGAGEMNPMFGKTHTPEYRKQVRDFFTGTTRSDQVRKQLSMQKLGEKNPMYNKVYSKKEREALCVSHLGEKYFERVQDLENIEKTWGWKSRLATKWKIDTSSVSQFIERYCNREKIDRKKYFRCGGGQSENS
jgi:hypothetical protein